MSAVKDPRVGIYCRVSTASQSVDPQESALQEYTARRDWTNVRVFADKAVSGMRERRPALDELMLSCRRRELDVVLVWRFDRFGRSVRHLLETLEEFRQLEIQFISMTEALDSSTPSGRLFFALVATIANFERDLLAERVKLGLAESRRRGTRLGRPPAPLLKDELVERVRKDRTQQKLSLRQLATKHGLPLWRVQKLCVGRAFKKQ